ncbi:MAG: esterase [Saprospiraceae bacterium]|jgi:esterase
MILNYKEFGQGDPVIILHGLFGNLDNWQTIAKQLARDNWVFILDQRNHGRSPHVDEISYPLMAEDLKAFMDQHWIPKAHIIGHSMGGKTAMQFAFEYPDMVDKLVVVDIAPAENKTGHQAIFDALLSLPVEKITSRSEAEEGLKTKIEDHGVRQFLLKNLSRDKGNGYKWKMNLQAIHNNYQKILAAIKSDMPYDGESLFITGALSDYVKAKEEKEIHQLFTSATIQNIENAGHWVHADAPEELLNKVNAFLNQG